MFYDYLYFRISADELTIMSQSGSQLT